MMAPKVAAGSGRKRLRKMRAAGAIIHYWRENACQKAAGNSGLVLHFYESGLDQFLENVFFIWLREAGSMLNARLRIVDGIHCFLAKLLILDLFSLCQ